MADLTRAILTLLGSRPSPARRREVASQLREAADKQQAIADAEERERRKPPEKRLRRPGGKGGRPSAPWVRIEREPRAGGAEILRIKLSRSLYYKIGSPERLDPQRQDDRLVLVPARGDAGYKVSATAGLVRVTASGARDIVGLDDGRYSAEVRGGVIVVGALCAHNGGYE